jgi:hypothetical protein
MPPMIHVAAASASALTSTQIKNLTATILPGPLGEVRG